MDEFAAVTLRSLAGIPSGTWIALAGWLVTGIGWFISQRAQLRLFRYQVRNTARGEIVKELRKQQSHVSAESTVVLGISIDHEYGSTTDWPEGKWLAQFEKYRATWKKRSEQWIFLLEQHEVLFPETAECRRQLVLRTQNLREDVRTFFVDLLTSPKRADALGRAPALRSRLADESALIEDLLVHVQNVTLGKVMGRAVPFRQPPDPTIPRIVMRGKQLEIVDGIK